MHQQRSRQDGAVGDLAAQISTACSALPPGPAVEQLRNFCGRSWELLHTPSYAALERQWLTEVPHHPDLTRFYAEKVYGTIHAMLAGILERGIATPTRSGRRWRSAATAPSRTPCRWCSAGSCRPRRTPPP